MQLDPQCLLQGRMLKSTTSEWLLTVDLHRQCDSLC